MSEQNSFIDAMGAEKPSTPSVGPENISKFPVDPKAETVLNVFAVVLLVIGIIGGFFCLIAGLVQLSDPYFGGVGWGLVLTGIFIALIGLLQWAALKVLVNISRNLYNINASINEKK